MYLKEIQLENFKSFGRKTTIPFLEGYTCITGPNGSGKSNISDAILFVLGPKSSKAMRAGRLTDLIFNGGSSKKPAKFTKVTLVFDNKSRIIPVDTDDVHLTRLVKLSPSSADSYYSYFYVNGKSSSLQEFDTLLAHARISADGYNLVQQGDVTRITDMGKVDRRRILDGIAGITQYDEDINKAEIKRKDVEDNLDKIDTLLREVRKRTRQLSKDREDAIKYRDIKGKADLAKVQMAFKKKDSLEEQIVSGRNLIKKYGEEQGELEDTLQEMKRKHIDLSKKVDEIEKRMTDLRGEDAKHVKEKIDDLRLNVFKANDGIEKAKFNIKQLKEKRTSLTSDLRKAKKELDNLKTVVQKLAEEISSKKDELKEKEADLNELEEHVTRSDSKALAIQREIVMKRKELDRSEEERHQMLLEKDRADDRLERLTAEIAQMEETVKKYEFEVKDIDYQLREYKKEERVSSTKLKSLNDNYTDQRTKLEKLLKESRQLEETVIQLRRDYEMRRAESQAQESVLKGYSRAVEAILEARDKGTLKGVHGTIAELGRVKKDYEDALAVAAGPRMQAIVVDNDEIAAKAINMLKQKKLGRGIFLPLNKMITGRPGGKALMAMRDSNSMGLGTELVKYKDKYKGAFWFVFGDTVVVKDLTSARKLMGGVRLVTLDGELCEKTGAMIGGNLAPEMMKFGQVQASEIDKVSKDLRKAMDRADKVSKEIKTIRIEMDKVETDLKSFGPEISLASKVSDLEFRRKEFVSKKDAMKKELANLEKERDTTEANKVKINRRLAEVEGLLEGLGKEREEKNKMLLKATPQELQKKIKDLRQATTTLANEIRDMTTSHDTNKAKIDFLEQRVHEVEDELAECKTDLKENEDAVSQFKVAAIKNENELKALKQVTVKADSEFQGLMDDRDNVYKENTTLGGQIDKLEEQLETKDDLILQQKDKIRALEEQLQEQIEEVSHIEKKVTGPLPPLQELQETVRQCEKEMEALEPVNMKALEDFEKEEARMAEMGEEISRLKDQRKNLMKVVDELNSKKKTGLMKVFNAINKNFKRVFAQLSVGGEAELFLENPESPFEGGLIIKAKPKDKKVLRLEALSGGEKSMTALGLIFAIQQYQPSPFYLLDEVDMFLDAINAEAVAQMIRSTTVNAQFIQITLRKATLDQTDHLYGVTIQKSGISQVIGNLNIGDVSKDGALKLRGGAKVVSKTKGKTKARPTKTVIETATAEAEEEEEEEEDEA